MPEPSQYRIMSDEMHQAPVGRPSIARFAPTMRVATTAVLAFLFVSHSIEEVSGASALGFPLWATDPQRAFVAYHDSSAGQTLYALLCLFGILVAVSIVSSFLQQFAAATPRSRGMERKVLSQGTVSQGQGFTIRTICAHHLYGVHTSPRAVSTG